ncbi:unnamed protein product [Prunus brigantina]
MINYNVDLLKLPKFTDPVMERSLESLNSFLHTVSSKLTDLDIERQLKLEKRLVFIPNVYKDLKPGVVGTYDDLVLCCAAKYHQRDYYICNPYTQQWVALPPSPQCHKRLVAVGFIYDHKKKATQQINNAAAEYIYRHRVVSILEFSHCQAYTFKYYMEIFSSETREWRASYISFPKKLAFHSVNPSIGFAHKGMLFLKAFWVGRDEGRAFLIGFDPFDTKENHGTIDIKCFIEFDQPAIEGLGDVSEIECLGVCQGCLRMFNFELRTGTLLVWDFKLVEPADQMVNGGNCLILKHRVPMDPEILLSNAVIFSHNELDMHWIKVCALDPNNENILYLSIGRHFFMCNILTKSWLVIAEKERARKCCCSLPTIDFPPSMANPSS